MDIVKRAYLKIKEEMEGDQDTWEFHTRVRNEVIRLIKVRAYSGRDWPREFGSFPDELKKRRQLVCTEENPCCDRRGEYNGFASGPLLFECPKHCSCHD